MGKVESNKMDKTVTVRVPRLVKHPVVGKIIKLSTKVHAHDKKNEINEIINQQEINLVISEINFKDGDVKDILKLFKKNNIDIPLVVFTSESNENKSINLLKSGASGFITKNLRKKSIKRILQDIAFTKYGSKELNKYTRLKNRFNFDYNTEKLNSLSKRELMALGLSLGADIPFFIFGENAWVEGIGEKLSQINIPDSIYYLCYPNFSISTDSIFKSFELTKVPITLKITSYFSDKLEQESNDLEYTITKKYGKMSELVSWMNNYGLAKISGTGSSVFVKIEDVNKIQHFNDKKPIDTKSFVVKGLSKHPFYDV